MLTWQVLSILGLIVGARISNVFLKMRIVDERFKHHVTAICMICVIAINLISQRSSMLQGFLLLIMTVTPFLLLRLSQAMRMKGFDMQIVSILDSLIIRMRSGMALRTAIHEETSFLPHWFQPIWINFFSKNEFQIGTGTQREIQFLNHLAQIEVKKSRQLEKLKALRDRFYMQAEFRQKSSRALMQNKIQSVILSVLFFAVIAFHSFRDEKSKNFSLFITAAAIFAVGTIWLWRIGRTYRWKI